MRGRPVTQIASPGVEIPTWLFAGGLGLLLGIFLGPTIMLSSAAGAERLARMAAEKISRERR